MSTDWGHSVQNAVQGSAGSLGELHHHWGPPMCSLHARGAKCESRQTEQGPDITPQVGTELEISPPSVPLLGNPRNRCFCKPHDLKVQVFLQHGEGPKVPREWPPPALGGEVCLPFPLYSPSSESCHKTPGRTSSSYPDSTMVASASLILHSGQI